MNCNLPEVNEETVRKQFEETLQQKIQDAKELFEANLQNIIDHIEEERKEPEQPLSLACEVGERKEINEFTYNYYFEEFSAFLIAIRPYGWYYGEPNSYDENGTTYTKFIKEGDKYFIENTSNV